MWTDGAGLCGGKPIESYSEQPVVTAAEAALSLSTSGTAKAAPSSVDASTVASGPTSPSLPTASTPLSSSPSPDTNGGSLVFSPTRTEEWLLCPMLATYKRRWVPLSRREAPWTPYLALGNAIHAGLAAHFQDFEHAEQIAHLTLEREFEEGSAWTLEGLKRLVLKGLRASLDSPLLGPDDQVVATELTIGECRADLVFRTPGVGLHVWDYKTKLELKTEWIPRELAPYEESWQLQHTAWAVQEHFGEPVVEAGVQLIVLSPRCKAYPVSMKLDPERIANWLRTAERVWVHMGEEPWMNTRSCRKFGRCEFWNACHVLNGDESRFPTLYERTGG